MIDSMCINKSLNIMPTLIMPTKHSTPDRCLMAHLVGEGAVGQKLGSK